MKAIFSILFLLFAPAIYAQGPYAPAANLQNSTAVHKDSSIFVSWATGVDVLRGKQDIGLINSDTVSVGEWSNVLGKADGVVTSLGDSGIAIIQFDGLLYNGLGADFAIFENAFNHTFLELAFVEVSSNGIDFFRFPAHSLTDTATPVGSFGSVEPTMIHNLAGKYTINYGTPFDLSDLDSINELDLNAISHIRIVDAIGTLDATHVQRDCFGRKVNDQYPTPFPSGGFDLDAIGAVYMKGVGFQEKAFHSSTTVYPNPSSGVMKIYGLSTEISRYKLINIQGIIVDEGKVLDSQLDFSALPSGCYNLIIVQGNDFSQHKIVIR